jgi:nucleoid-associated protein YgaU
MNNTKLFIFSSLALFLVNCAGTSPSISDVAKSSENQNNKQEQKQEVSVEKFTIQEPESPMVGVNVFEPYMIKRGDILTRIALNEYGNASMWKEIYAWNKEIIGGNPDKIFPYNFLSLKRKVSEAKNCDIDYFQYEIQPGDTAWNLAQRVYGDELAWVVIYMDNSELISSNNGILQPGTFFKMRKNLDPCS